MSRSLTNLTIDGDQRAAASEPGAETWLIAEILEYIKHLEERVSTLEFLHQENTKHWTKEPRTKDRLLQEAAWHCLHTGMSLRATVKIKKFKSISKSNLGRLVKQKKENK